MGLGNIEYQAKGFCPMSNEQFRRALSKITQVWNIIRGLLVKKVVDIGGASEEARRIRGSQYSKLSLVG
jgi:hypothetical protein